jgi:hypothetical protein
VGFTIQATASLRHDDRRVWRWRVPDKDDLVLPYGQHLELQRRPTDYIAGQGKNPSSEEPTPSSDKYRNGKGLVGLDTGKVYGGVCELNLNCIGTFLASDFKRPGGIH